MRLLHTADWHLGVELHGFDRRVEHDVFLEWLRRTVDQEDVDALLVAGDVFHTTNPSIAAQKQFYALLYRLTADHPDLDIVVVGGNHDSAARLELPAALMRSSRVRLVGAPPRREGRIDPSAMLAPLRTPDGAPAAVCAAVPYLRASDLDGYRDGDRGDDAAALKAFYADLADAAAQIDAPLIVTGHLHISGGDETTESERPILIGDAAAAPLDIFPEAAVYAALGHLHRPQTLRAGDRAVRYAGSPFPMSCAERLYRHSVSIVEITDAAPRVSVLETPRPTPFLRAPERGAAPLDDVLDALRALKPPPPGPAGAAFLEVCVELAGPEPDLRAKIDAALGDQPVRLVRITRARPEGTRGAASNEETERWEAPLPPQTAFEDLHRQRYGAEPSPELAAAFQKLLADAMSPPDAPSEIDALAQAGGAAGTPCA